MNVLYVNSLEANNKELARQLASANVLIAEQNKLAKERQEWALLTNEVIRSLNQQLQEVRNAIGSPEYMDPPDGGSVTIAGHVSRMREDRDQLRQQLEKIQEHCRDYAAQAETDAGIIKADGKEIHSLRQQFAFATQERNGYREAQDLACEERDELRQQVTLLLELANKCHIELVVQIHELADHIERARGCITDQDMLNQINGQRDYALKVSDNWNQNGNPFESLSATNEN